MMNFVPSVGQRARSTPPAARATGELGLDQVYLLFTSMEETDRALGVASHLAKALGSRLVVIHCRTVPFGEPLEAATGRSPIEGEGFMARLEAQECDTDVRVYLCRDARRTMESLFAKPSIVVMGHQRRWRRTPADRWRRGLEAAGHFVVVVDGNGHA